MANILGYGLAPCNIQIPQSGQQLVVGDVRGLQSCKWKRSDSQPTKMVGKPHRGPPLQSACSMQLQRQSTKFIISKLSSRPDNLLLMSQNSVCTPWGSLLSQIPTFTHSCAVLQTDLQNLAILTLVGIARRLMNSQALTSLAIVQFRDWGSLHCSGGYKQTNKNTRNKT